MINKKLEIIRIVEDLSMMAGGGMEEIKFSNAVSEIEKILEISTCSRCYNRFDDKDLALTGNDPSLYCHNCINKLVEEN